MLLFSICLTVAFTCWWLTVAITVCLWRLLRRSIAALPAGLAVDFLFLLQLLPLFTSSAVVALFVIPGFAVWEPANSSESLNLWLALPTIIYLAVLLRSLRVLAREVLVDPKIRPDVPFVAVLGCLRQQV